MLLAPVILGALLCAAPEASARRLAANPLVSQQVLSVPPNEYHCTTEIHKKANIKPGKHSTLKFVTLASPASTPTILHCTIQCIQTWSNDAPCVGFIQRTPTTCMLAMTSGATAKAVIQPVASSRRNGPTSILLHADCFDPVDTAAPTPFPSNSNTASPTSPPASPTSPPGICSDSTIPSGMSNFYQVITVDKTCQIAEVAGLGVSTYTYSNFQCGLEDCVRKCNYDQYCEYIMYSDTEKVCIKSSMLQTTDSPQNFLAYKTQGWVAYARTFADGGEPFLCPHVLNFPSNAWFGMG